jgi:3-phosphoshikimate 1-carboxyvinyltransferase
VRPCGPVRGSIRPPGSKSITNRALVCAALADGQSALSGALDSEDTRVMLESLRALGVTVECSEDRTELGVTGCRGKPARDRADLFVANSGTTIRFLTAMLAGAGGEYRLHGVERMHERPIEDLLDPLRRLGAEAVSELNNGCPPVIIRSTGLQGGLVRVRGDISSQYLSGLLMAAPLAHFPLQLIVDGPLVSQPYVRMTLEVMKSFGIDVETTCPDGETSFASRSTGWSFQVAAPRIYRAARYAIEPDASAASYFWGVAAVTGGDVTVLGLSREALQGDVGFCECLERMGCVVSEEPAGLRVQGRALHGIDVDMNAISDTVQTLAVVALMADGPTTIRGVAHIRHKETDRIGDLARELRKLGATVDEYSDGLRITPGALRGAELATYRDHRMAMSFALAGLRIPGVTILDPGCVEKTYPHYFRDLEVLTRPSE